MSEPKVIQKAPGIVRQYSFTWEDAADDPITASTWTPAAGITIDGDDINGDGSATLLMLSGGADATNYVLRNDVIYTSGQTDFRYVTVEVRVHSSSIPIITTSGDSANSYVSIAEADLYFAGRLYSDDWAEASSSDKEKALIMAAKRIDQENFIGTITSTTQSLKWPRAYVPVVGENYLYGVRYYDSNTIPQQVKDAQCEYALLMIGSDVLAQQNLSNFKHVTVGPISVEFNQPISSGVLPDQVSRLLRGLRVNSAGAAMVRA